MRVLVAGATGVIGRQVVPLLHGVGHEVFALSRPLSTATIIPGVRHVQADTLDRESLVGAVRQAAPDAIVNLLTAIPRVLEPRHLAAQMALTIACARREQRTW